MNPVTDPALLEELDRDAGPMRLEINGTAADMVPVEDPALLEQLEAGSVAPGALAADPDRVTRARRAAELTGIPTPVVERNLERVEQKYRLNQIEEYTARDPALARMMSDPETARIAHDDVEQMGLAARTAGAFKRGVANLRQTGSVTAARSNQATLSNIIDIERRMTLGEYIPDHEDTLGVRFLSAEDRAALRADLQAAIGASTANIAARQIDKEQTVQALPSVQRAMQAKTFGEFFENFKDAPFEFVVSIGAESLPNMAPGIAAATVAAPLGLPAAAAAMGAGSFGVDYGASILKALAEEGVNLRDKAALEAATADQALMQRIGRKAFAHASVVGALDAASGGAAAIRMGRTALGNMGGQLAAQGALGGAGEAGGTIAAGDELAVGEIMAEVLGETVTAPVEVATMAASRATETIQQQRAKADRAAEGAKIATKLLGDSAASKARARDPEAFRRYLTDATTDENGDVAEVFIDGEVFRQSIGDEQLVELQEKAPELAQQIVEAVETGGDVRMPVADFVTAFAGTPTGEALAQHVRRGADEMSAAEAVVFASTEQESFRQEMEQVARRMQEQVEAAEDQQTVFGQILERLGRANRFSEDVNRINAAIPAAIIQTMAARQGLTAQEMAARWLPNVVGENPAAPGEVLTATDDPQFRAWFGDSKVVDESGAPLRVYHGTNADVRAFDPAALGSATGHHTSALGFYFSADSDTASTFAEGDGAQTVPVYVNIQNPYEMSAGEFESLVESEEETGASIRQLREALIAEGYDGIVVRADDESMMEELNTGDTWVAFRPEQIKSVFNRGTWDPNDPNVLNQSAPADSRVKNQTAAIRKLLKLLTPEERQKITDATAAKIIAQLKRLPSAKEMAAVAHAGRAKRGWYAESAEAISEVFAADAPRFAALLAAMSPQTSVENNLLNTLNTWKNWVAAGRPTERAEIVEIMGRSVQGNKGADSVLDAWINNSVRALSTENPGELMISGPKVNSFFRNLVGVTDEVTNDAWMANYALVDQTIFAGGLNAKGTDPGKGSGYLAMSARVREAAGVLTKMTGETWTPAEVQETIWSWAKTLFELQAAAGETRGARQLLLDGELTDDLINSTPDFSSLFLKEPYSTILIEAGYGNELNAITLATTAGKPIEGSGAGGEAAPFDRATQVDLEQRAARRLERLAAERGITRQFTVDLADPAQAEPVVVNIGLATNDGGSITTEDVTRALGAIGVRVISSKRYQSNTEPTMVARLSRELNEEEIDALSAALRQDAIAMMVGDRGFLWGPKKEAWGPFNPEFFIKLDGKRANEGVLAQSARPAVQQPLVGIHFSRGARTVLDGRYYGRGLKGEEAARVNDPDADPRLRDRVYVYVDQGAGVRPEDGVGGVAHEVVLPRLYDWDGDPLRLRRPNDPNGNETRVLDAGFAGYFVRSFGSNQGAAVILGPASHGLQARVVQPTLSTAAVAPAIPQVYKTPLMSSEIKAIDEAQLQAAAPSAKVRSGTLSVDVSDLAAAREALAKMGVKIPEDSLAQPVYHGTPHEFERFDLSKINTGEGAQAYGWGLYFADSREVATSYREKLSSNSASYTVDGKEVWNSATSRYGTPEHIVALALYDGDAKRVRDLIADYRRVGMADKVEGLETLLREWEGKSVKQHVKKGGRLLRADVPDDAVARMLLWDAPLSEQPYVQQALGLRIIDESSRFAPSFVLETDVDLGNGNRARWPIGAFPSREAAESAMQSLAGAEVYQYLERTSGDRETSRLLAAAGIPGNRYLDGGSRGKGGGTYNTVVWDQAVLDEINASLLAEFEQREGATRGTFSPSTNTIALLEKADLSTFLHEVGHWGLELLVESAGQPGAPQQIIDDARTLLAFAGVESLQAWNSMTLEQRRAHHENVAEAFETYLFEGKAPSAELQGAFSRIAQWMKNVYRALTGMRVQLTDEVRGVFDRMLATDEQIAEQSRIRAMAPLFETAEAAGMTAEQWQAYQATGAQAAQDAVDELRSRSLRDMKWLSNAKGRALKKLQAQAKEARKGLRAEVEEEVDAQPVYAALRFIQRGEAGDRNLTNAQRKALDTVAGGKTKLDLGVLKEMYGDSWPVLATRLQHLAAAEGGAHPDAVAAAFGFDSGDALVRAILAAEPREQLVEALTDRRMLERHADLSDPEALERAAEAAIHNEARIRFVATEYKALADAMNPREQVGETKITRGKNKGQVRAVTVNSLVRAANQYAEAIVGRTVVRKLNAAVHARTAANEARAARAAMAEGDTQKALAHKRNQLLHERTSKAVEDARAEVDKSIGYLKKFRNSNRARGAIDADYVEAIENLLVAIDLRSASNRRLDSLASLRKWMKDQEAQGLPVALDPELIESLHVQNVRDMTVEQLRGLVDQVKSIEHLGKLKKKLLTARDQREFDSIAESLAESIREHGGKKRVAPIVPEEGLASKVRGFFAEHRKISSLARQMDGVVDDGPMWRALVRGMNDAGNRETSLIHGSTVVLTEIFKPLLAMKGGMTGDMRLIASLGQSLSRGSRISVALNWGNEANRQRVLNTIPQAAVDEIFATLTNAEWDAVEAIWAHINEFWPDIAAKEKRVTGVAPEKVEAAPFVVRVDGQEREMAGGYYPIVYNSDVSDVAAAHENAQIAKDMLAGAYGRQTTRRGHTKKRAEKVGEPLRFTLDVIERHISQVVHDLSWHEWLIDANRLLKDARISSAIREHYGNETLQAMREALRDIATGDLQHKGKVERAVAWARTRVSAATMGWSATTSLLQPFGLFQSIPRVGAKWILRGMKHWAGDMARFENAAALIREKSEMMRHRSTTMNRDIREITGRIHHGKSKAAEAFEASMFIAIQKLQLVADIPTWYGAYEKALAENPHDDARAVALADQAVVDAQGGGQVKDLAGVQRGNEMKRALSMFYSYFSATWNIASESTARTDFRKPAQVAGWLADMAVLSVVPTLAQQVIWGVIRGGDDDDDEFADKLVEFGQELAGFWLGTLIGVREFAGMVQGFDYSGPAAFRVIAEIGNLVKFGADAVTPDEELDDNDYRRALKAVLTVLGLPSTQIDRSWRGWKAWEDGEAGPGAVLLGPPPRER